MVFLENVCASKLDYNQKQNLNTQVPLRDKNLDTYEDIINFFILL